MAQIIMTAELASALSKDAGNTSMRRNGRLAWNADDAKEAQAVIDKLARYVSGWTPENPLTAPPDWLMKGTKPCFYVKDDNFCFFYRR